MLKKNMIIPERFVGLDINSLKVELVQTKQGRMVCTVYSCLAEASEFHDLNKFLGPMTGYVQGSLCLRFEDSASYKQLSE